MHVSTEEERKTTRCVSGKHVACTVTVNEKVKMNLTSRDMYFAMVAYFR